MISLHDFLRAYSDWIVVFYDPKQHNGAIRCPRCWSFIESVVSFGPPYMCMKDKVFFDPCLAPESLHAKAQVHAGFWAHDLREFWSKYHVVHEVLRNTPSK